MFQSTPSGGKATANRNSASPSEAFQSTPSGGKATADTATALVDYIVSIHAFRGEGDFLLTQRNEVRNAVSIHAFRGEGDEPEGIGCRRADGFNPRLPGGRRQGLTLAHNDNVLFQSTPSGGKATRTAPPANTYRRGFNPRLPGGRRRVHPRIVLTQTGFNPRLPGGRRRQIERIEEAHDGFNPRLPGGRRPKC